MVTNSHVWVHVCVCVCVCVSVCVYTQVPRDVEVVMACIADERRKARTTHHPPSTYTHDMAQIGTPSDIYTIANITPPDTPHTPQHTAGAAGPSGDAPGSVSQGCLSEGWSLRALLSGSGKGKGGGSVGTSSGGSRGGGMQEACGSVETGGGGGMDSGQLLSADNTPVKGTCWSLAFTAVYDSACRIEP